MEVRSVSNIMPPEDAGRGRIDKRSIHVPSLERLTNIRPAGLILSINAPGIGLRQSSGGAIQNAVDDDAVPEPLFRPQNRHVLFTRSVHLYRAMSGRVFKEAGTARSTGDT